MHQRTSGSKRLHHPLAGDRTVDFETLALPADSAQVFAYSPAAGTSPRRAMDLLASGRTPERRDVRPDGRRLTGTDGRCHHGRAPCRSLYSPGTWSPAAAVTTASVPSSTVWWPE